MMRCVPFCRVLSVVVMSLLLTVPAAVSPSVAADFNEHEPNDCQDNGWQSLYRMTDGSPFRGEAECTGFSKAGGILIDANTRQCFGGFNVHAPAWDPATAFTSMAACLDYGRGGGHIVPATPAPTPTPTPGPTACELANAHDSDSGIILDLSGRDLAGCEFTSRIYRNINFSGANLTGVTSRNRGFRNVAFTNANLTNAEFESMSFINVDLSGANLTGVEWNHGSILASAASPTTTFAHSSLSYVTFAAVDLTGVDFTGADLYGMNWFQVTCPDGTNSGDAGDSCEGHLVVAP